MTRKQLSEFYQISQSSIQNNWKRTQQMLKKKYGVQIIKLGRGESAHYEFKEDGITAASIFQQETKSTALVSLDELRMQNFQFGAFIFICFLPLQVWKGSYKYFLQYTSIPQTPHNIQKLKQAFTALAAKQMIIYTIDPSDPEYFMAGLMHKAEQQLFTRITIQTARICKTIADKNKKKDWIPLVKTWLGIEMLYQMNAQPYTMKTLQSIAGLNEYQTKESVKLLKENNIFAMSKAYLAFDRCIGTTAQLNAFYKENNQ